VKGEKRGIKGGRKKRERTGGAILPLGLPRQEKGKCEKGGKRGWEGGLSRLCMSVGSGRRGWGGKELERGGKRGRERPFSGQVSSFTGLIGSGRGEGNPEEGKEGKEEER